MYYLHFTNICIEERMYVSPFPPSNACSSVHLPFKYKFRHNIQISAPRKNWVAFDFY